MDVCSRLHGKRAQHPLVRCEQKNSTPHAHHAENGHVSPLLSHAAYFTLEMMAIELPLQC